MTNIMVNTLANEHMLERVFIVTGHHGFKNNELVMFLRAHGNQAILVSTQQS